MLEAAVKLAALRTSRDCIMANRAAQSEVSAAADLVMNLSRGIAPREVEKGQRSDFLLQVLSLCANFVQHETSWKESGVKKTKTLYGASALEVKWKEIEADPGIVTTMADLHIFDTFSWLLSSDGKAFVADAIDDLVQGIANLGKPP
jgi:hypothetical protein